MRALILAAIASAAPAAAFAAIVVEHPEIRPTYGNQATTAAYMILRNTGPAPDRLVGAACACAASVMGHRTVTENGVSRMVMEMTTEIPAHGAAVFDAKGRHLMLTGVKRPIRDGERAPITLTFAKAGKVQVMFVATDLAGLSAGPQKPH